jgi:hypothetical protein
LGETVKRIPAILAVTAFCALGLIGGGIQGGVISPDDLDISYYIGGHLSVVEMVPKLVLWLPGEYWFAGNKETQYRSDHILKTEVSDYSFAAQARYCFTGLAGPFAGGGLRAHIINEHHIEKDTDGVVLHDWDDNDTLLGLDLVGGYAFASDSILVTPEASFQIGGQDSFKLGVDFTFR